MSAHPGPEPERELLATEVLAERDWTRPDGADIAPGRDERETWTDLPLPGRLLGSSATCRRTTTGWRSTSSPSGAGGRASARPGQDRLDRP